MRKEKRGPSPITPRSQHNHSKSCLIASRGGENLLLGGWGVGEGDTLLDVALQTLEASIQQCLLLLGNVGQRVRDLLSTVGLEIKNVSVAQDIRIWKYEGNILSYAELNGNGEEVQASGLGNLVTTGNTRQVDEARLDQTLLALDGPQELLGKAVS